MGDLKKLLSYVSGDDFSYEINHPALSSNKIVESEYPRHHFEKTGRDLEIAPKRHGHASQATSVSLLV
jgi:hypothetical protein